MTKMVSPGSEREPPTGFFNFSDDKQLSSLPFFKRFKVKTYRRNNICWSFRQITACPSMLPIDFLGKLLILLVHLPETELGKKS